MMGARRPLLYPTPLPQPCGYKHHHSRAAVRINHAATLCSNPAHPLGQQRHNKRHHTYNFLGSADTNQAYGTGGGGGGGGSGSNSQRVPRHLGFLLPQKQLQSRFPDHCRPRTLSVSVSCISLPFLCPLVSNCLAVVDDFYNACLGETSREDSELCEFQKVCGIWGWPGKQVIPHELSPDSRCSSAMTAERTVCNQVNQSRETIWESPDCAAFPVSFPGLALLWGPLSMTSSRKLPSPEAPARPSASRSASARELSPSSAASSTSSSPSSSSFI